MGRDNGNLSTLKPQPGQTDPYNPTFHPLPGPYAQKQLNSDTSSSLYQQAENGSRHSTGPTTEISKALAAENSQHEYWEKWQGVSPGKPVYEDPRAFQNTLLPVARFGTDGRGD